MRRRAVPLAMLAGGSLALVLGALSAAAAAGASTPTTADPGLDGGAANLGGFQISAAGAGVSASYEQPNFPVPATPTLELNLGYSHATFDYGPIGQATASTLWPGQVVAGSGSQLGALFPGVPLPPAPDWPVQAHAAYPQGPTSATDDQGPLTMVSATGASGSSSQASVGTSGAMAAASAIVSIQDASSSAYSTVDASGALAKASSSVHGIQILGGLVKISAVDSEASATSDGKSPSVSGSSTAVGVRVAGQQVDISKNGLRNTSLKLPLPLGSLFSSVDQVLKSAGISITLEDPSDSVFGPVASREVAGLQVSVNLTTLDANLDKLAGLIPPQVTANLPLPVPDKQILVLDIGWVNVSAAATPPFNFSIPTSEQSYASPPAYQSPGSEALPNTLPGSSLSNLASTPGAGISSPSANSAGPTAGSGTSAPSVLSGVIPAALFKGLSGGLLVLGLLLGSLGAFALVKADALLGAKGGSTACAQPTHRPRPEGGQP